MTDKKLRKRGHLFTFLCLYIAQSIPMSFFSTVLPVMFRQNDVSLEAIGLLQLLKLPWILKFIWSPGIDRSAFRLRDFKTWIFSSELIYASIIFAVAFLDLETWPHLIVVLILFSFIASATQDIATDSLAVLTFGKKDRSLANSMQSIGSFAGAMIGGGVLLLMFHKIGWSSLLPYLALFVILALIPLFFFRRGEGHVILKERQKQKPHPDDLFGFFKQKGIWKQVTYLFLVYAGLVGILAMLKPMLVDYGYNMKEIGIMVGIIGTSVACISSFLGGFIIKKMGRHTSRILFALIVLLATVYFSLLQFCLPINTATLHFGICLLWGSYGMAMVIVYTTAMDCVRDGYEGTDFTMQTVITHFSAIIIGASSGKLAAEFTYQGLFLIEFIIAAIAFIFVIWAFGVKDKSKI